MRAGATSSSSSQKAATFCEVLGEVIELERRTSGAWKLECVALGCGLPEIVCFVQCAVGRGVKELLISGPVIRRAS